MSDDKQQPEGEEFDQLIANLEQVERARKQKVLLITVVLFIVGGLAIAGAYTYREALFVPDLRIAEGEAEVLAETNDPQCRAFIANVTDIGKRFAANQTTLEEQLLSEDVEKVKAGKESIAKFRAELEKTQEDSKAANLRFDESPEELRQWYKHILNEMRILDDVANNAIERLAPKPEPEEGAEEKPEGLVELTPKPKTKKRPPKERVDGAMLATDDAFQNFRVWHTSSLHPCGKADEGETPWEPEAELPKKANP